MSDRISDETGVHVSHCCGIHGCKYGDPDCPVENGTYLQDHPCEECDEDKEAILNFLRTPDAIEQVQKILRESVMPWTKNHIRKNGMGETIGTVDPRMGGFSNELHGDGLFGYRAGGQGSALTRGSGACTSGHTDSLEESKRIIDAFIRKVRPDMVFVEETEKLPLVIWTHGYRPFVMGGDCNYILGTKVYPLTEPQDLGQGLRGYVITKPNGDTCIAEAETGAIVGKTLADVRGDIQAARVSVINEQMRRARENAKKVEAVPAEEFWPKMGAEK